MSETELGEEFDGVPNNLRSLIKIVGFIDTELDEGMTEAYAPLTRGQCMTCHSPLGGNTVLFVTSKGIVAGYCSGPCVQDHAVLGWIQEQHDDLIDSISFRGGRGDEPE